MCLISEMPKCTSYHEQHQLYSNVIHEVHKNKYKIAGGKKRGKEVNSIKHGITIKINIKKGEGGISKCTIYTPVIQATHRL